MRFAEPPKIRRTVKDCEGVKMRSQLSVMGCTPRSLSKKTASHTPGSPLQIPQHPSAQELFTSSRGSGRRSTGVETQSHGTCRFYGSSHGWRLKKKSIYCRGGPVPLYNGSRAPCVVCGGRVTGFRDFDLTSVNVSSAQTRTIETVFVRWVPTRASESTYSGNCTVDCASCRARILFEFNVGNPT